MFFLQVYKVGEHILARWSDCKMYPAKIVAANDNGQNVKLIFHLARDDTLSSPCILAWEQVVSCRVSLKRHARHDKD